MSKWIKKGDNVVVITGNDKGKSGTVLARVDDRVVIKGVNIRKKHVKSRERTSPSRIVEMELPIHVSNAALCDEQGNRIKVKCRTTAAGVKELYYMKENREVVHRQLSKQT